MKRGRRPTLAVVLGFFLVAVIAPSALAAVSITRAELNGSTLRVEGRGATPNTRVTVNGGQASGISDGSGNFRIESGSFPKPADCRVVVSDGTSSATATLSGCTVSSPPPSSSPSLSALAVRPTDVVGGDPATGTVTLTSAARSGGFQVALSSDNTVAATVPPSVTVAAGSSRATFRVSTKQVSNAQSAIIRGTAGGITRHSIITVWDPFHFSNGSISILPGGNGSGRVTSEPAGINCTITRGNGSGTCSRFFPVGTLVRLEARPAADSSFRGWSTNLPGCSDPSRIRVARGTNITCRPLFSLR
ncbi:MAG: hypothetical protein ACRDJ5_07725 [Actinomycetota bacterium]